MGQVWENTCQTLSHFRKLGADAEENRYFIKFGSQRTWSPQWMSVTNWSTEMEATFGLKSVGSVWRESNSVSDVTKRDSESWGASMTVVSAGFEAKPTEVHLQLLSSMSLWRSLNLSKRYFLRWFNRDNVLEYFCETLIWYIYKYSAQSTVSPQQMAAIIIRSIKE